MTRDQIASVLLAAARSAVAATLGERAEVVWPLVEPEARAAAEESARELLEVMAASEPLTGTKARTIRKSVALNEPKPRNPRSFPSAPSIQARWYNSLADTAPWLYFGDPADLQFRAYVTWKGEPDPRAQEARETLQRIESAKKQGWEIRLYRAGNRGNARVLERDGEFLTRAGFEMGGPIPDPRIDLEGAGYANMRRKQTELARAVWSWLRSLPQEQRQNLGLVRRKMGATFADGWAKVEVREPWGKSAKQYSLAYQPAERAAPALSLPGTDTWEQQLELIERLAT